MCFQFSGLRVYGFEFPNCLSRFRVLSFHKGIPVEDFIAGFISFRSSGLKGSVEV